MKRKQIAFAALGLFTFVGCEQKLPSPTTATDKSTNITMDDVKRDAAQSMNTSTAYSQQAKDRLVRDLQAQMVKMDANIEQLRLKGKDLTSEAKANWEVKMAALDEKRKLANAKLEAVSESTSEAWSDIEKGAKSAWEDLSKAFQDASSEF